MKKHKKAFMVTTEITIRGYVYYHSWIIKTFDRGYAEIILEQHVEELYKDQKYEYAISGVYEINIKDINLIKNFISELLI